MEENKELNSLFENAEDPVEVSLEGYEVTKAIMFSQVKEPAVTLWYDKVKFNMATLKRFPGVTHIHLLISRKDRRIIVRPCDKDAPDSLRWAIGGNENDVKNRDMVCKVFSAMVFDMMGWTITSRYKILGKPAVCGDEKLYLFTLADYEENVTDPSTKKTKKYLPQDWRDYFGTPVEKHEQMYSIDLADGYVNSTKVLNEQQ